MARLFVSDLATRDVSEILDDFEATFRFKAAVLFREDLKSIYDRLVDFPESGGRRDVFGGNVRVIPMRTHVVIYRHDASYEAVNVLRIVHGRRDLGPALLLPPAAVVALTLFASKEYPSLEMVKTTPWHLWLAGGVLGMTISPATSFWRGRSGRGR